MFFFVWGEACKTYFDKVLKLQKKALRFIFFTGIASHALPLLRDPNVLLVDLLYIHNVSKLMFIVV